MPSRVLITAAAALLAGSAAAYAQQTTPATTTTPTDLKSNWRLSKLVGLDVYNDSKEKIGDIDDVLIDSAGNVKSYVIGVGGFLNMGEHDVAVPKDQLKFSETAMNGATTGTSAGADNDWAPEHATMSTTREQLKAMPEYKDPEDT